MDNCRSVVCEHSPIDGRPRAHRIQRWYAISGSDIASVHDGGRRPSPERVPVPMTTSRTSTLLERRLATQAVSMQVAPRSIAACVRRCCPKNNVPSFRCMTAARCRRGHASNSTRSGSRGDAPRDRRDGGRDGGRYVTRDRRNNISVSVAWSASLWLAACSEDSPDGGRRKLR